MKWSAAPVAVAALLLLIAVAMAIVRLGSFGESSATSSGPPPVPPPERSLVGRDPLPTRLPGVTLTPFTARSDGVSLTFRLRNFILNGLPGQASDYRLEIAVASVQGLSGRLIGVSANPDAPAVRVGASIRKLVGVAPVRSERRAGHRLTVHVLSTYVLCVVDGGDRWALVTLAPNRATSLRISRRVADVI
ncbi:MAG: hypothetical protein KDC36_06550 [Thermoleophilia bacterium]|nr:hypothetical protein [Thermoleophilia bacterium]